MPLGRFGVRNEYSLGGKKLYKDGVESEDSKVIFDGVAVAGLVGLLRQLGDLSQFAAEIFHGLQEQVVSTASRSRKLVTRIQHIEAILPSLEKAMLTQTSHIHFAYTPGSEWHPRIKAQQNHFVYSDLPHFIMDSYEECREPPRLQLLDRFDTSGRGSCLKRYTDPTFFRRASAGTEARKRDKAQRERKARKKKRLSQRSGKLPNSVSTMNNNRRQQMSSQTGRGGSSVSHTGSSFDRTSRSDSLISKEGMGFVESLSQPGISIQADKTKREVISNINKNVEETSNAVTGKGIQDGLSTDTTAPRSSNVTWDEKLETMEHMGLNHGIEDDVQSGSEKNYYLHEKDLKPVSVKIVNQGHDLSEHESIPNSGIDQRSTEATMNVKSNEPTGVNYLHDQDVKLVDEIDSLADDLSEVVSGPNVNADAPQVISESFPQLTSDNNESVETSDANHLVDNTRGSIAADNFVSDRSYSKAGISDVQYLQETILDNTKMKSEITSDKCDGRVDHHANIDSETDNFVDARNAIDSESESDFETNTQKEVKLTSICKLPEEASTGLMVKHECHSKSYNHGDGVRDGAEKPIAPLSLANLECVENELSSKLLDLATSQEQPVESASFISKETQGIEADDIDLQLAVCKPVESSSQAPRDDETACTNGSVGIPSGSTSSYPHALWTNGTLLGLRPSKPTVFGASPAVNPTPVTGTAVSNGNGHCVDQCSPKVSRPAGTMSSSVKNYYHGGTFGGDSQDFGSLKYHSHYGKSNIKNDPVTVGLGNDLNNAVSEVSNTSEDKSSLLSLLSRNLLKKGPRMSESLSYEEKNISAKHLSVDMVSPTKFDGKSKSSVNSPSASPPLEHMKISFRPIDGLENSRLKLKYPEGVDHHEMTVETFPSFQLVPGSTSVHHDMGSDSDDDTFCRSYPCVSDESAGHLSDSDSEQWESGDSSENNNDHAIDDEPHGISSIGSSDLQCLAAQPPPLPPLQWRVSRPVLLGVEDTPKRGSDSLNQSFDSHPLEDDSAKTRSTMQETDTTVMQKKEIEVAVPNVDGQKQGCHATNVDERGDFLHQIRAKSFNLKRTDAARSVSTPSLPTSNKMTAILQKASAIRQVVGSDGEDDSWSDT
ncbi:protein SCAR3-like isoform X2 [Silene latifolia]|uniref:protein SCAR3-like isoform X2 n=1 Tax=Silene latifolia TaxID=37657 RepID=UPI003D76D2B3